MIVVCNTSSLTNLAAIGQLDLLRVLYGRIIIVPGVWEELSAEGGRWPGRDEVARAGWIERRVVENLPLVAALQRDLDRGESESIALAVALEADLVLLDEKEGRSAARRLGLRVAGVVGVLLEWKAQGILQAVLPHLDGLRHQAGFYLSDELYRHALILAGEARSGPTPE